MDPVRSLATRILEMHPKLFKDDFNANKELLSKVVIIRSKQLKNEVAGYITALMKEANAQKLHGVSESTSEATTKGASAEANHQ